MKRINNAHLLKGRQGLSHSRALLSTRATRHPQRVQNLVNLSFFLRGKGAFGPFSPGEKSAGCAGRSDPGLTQPGSAAIASRAARGRVL